jgi:hypothetical protein
MAVDLVADNDGAATYRRAEGRRETRQREGSWEALALWERGQVLGQEGWSHRLPNDDIGLGPCARVQCRVVLISLQCQQLNRYSNFRVMKMQCNALIVVQRAAQLSQTIDTKKGLNKTSAIFCKA